jgi:hypothetical protein
MKEAENQPVLKQSVFQPVPNFLSTIRFPAGSNFFLKQSIFWLVLKQAKNQPCLK